MAMEIGDKLAKKDKASSFPIAQGMARRNYSTRSKVETPLARNIHAHERSPGTPARHNRGNKTSPNRAIPSETQPAARPPSKPRTGQASASLMRDRGCFRRPFGALRSKIPAGIRPNFMTKVYPSNRKIVGQKPLFSYGCVRCVVRLQTRKRLRGPRRRSSRCVLSLWRIPNSMPK